MNKIALGTAQVGMSYGINNKRGKIPLSEVFEIFNKAIASGVNMLDTAYSYGDSEKIIGIFSNSSRKKLKVISKAPKCEYGQLRGIFESSLQKLGIPRIYGYLLHDFSSYKNNPRIWDELEKLKSEKKTQKIGFSLYYPQELDCILEKKLKVDMVQVPFSVFDQRFRPYFPELKLKNIEIYVRSVFLQGLVFKNPSELKGYLKNISSRIKKLYALSERIKVPVFALCLNYAILNNFVDKVVVGVDSLSNFNEIIQASNFINQSRSVNVYLSGLKYDDEKIVVPVNWEDG